MAHMTASVLLEWIWKRLTMTWNDTIGKITYTQPTGIQLSLVHRNGIDRWEETRRHQGTIAQKPPKMSKDNGPRELSRAPESSEQFA
jgi:hypothetical protein